MQIYMIDKKSRTEGVGAQHQGQRSGVEVRERDLIEAILAILLKPS